MTSPEKQPVINVVAALVIKGLQILVAKRRASDSNGGYWEFPGGKVELGETLQQALARELLEELEMPVQIGEFLEYRDFQTPTGRRIRLHLFVTEAQAFRFVLHEHDEACWLDWQDLETIDLIPGNRQFLPAIHEWFRQNRV